MFLRVTPLTGVGKGLKSQKLTLCFVGPYQILQRIGEVAYRITLPPSLANLHDVFHMSQLRRYIPDSSHVIQVDDLQVRDNLTVEVLPIQVEDREVKHLGCKEIALVKVVWGGPTGESFTWEREDQMKESYLALFSSSNFRGRKFSKWGKVVTPQFLFTVIVVNSVKLCDVVCVRICA